jgi:trimeric autotransporter adhesin
MNWLITIRKIAGLAAIVIFLGTMVTHCGKKSSDEAAPVPAAATFSGAVSMKTTLNGASEVPAVNTLGIGTAVFTVKPGTGELIGSVNFSGLSSNATLAHIHSGAAGANGGVLLALTGGAGGTSGTWTVPAGTVLAAADLSALISGGLYVNIHTANNGSGEIRGQIIFPSAAIATVLTGAEEVPAVTTSATGTGNLTVNLGTGAISGSVTFTGLSSNATLAHIHSGAAGANGGVLLALAGGAGGTSGTWTVPAGTVLAAEDLNSLITDGLYLNIHSANNQGGEIRGQIKYRIAYTPPLTGSQEVPPVSPAGTGTANLSVNPATGDISGTVSFSGMTSIAQLAHIHEGAAGTNGGVVLGLTGGEGGTSGTWTVPAGSVLNTARLNELKADGLYINVHTVNNAGGEIRAQLVSP